MKPDTLRRTALLALLAVSTCSFGATIPSDETIRSLIAQRIEDQKWATGIVVGITTPQGRRIIAHGTFDTSDRRPVDGRTVFEIASLTKVFTALLLADMASAGTIRLDDPASRCLPRTEVTLPERNGRQITFADLATHTSGLPLRPTNLEAQSSLDKYAGYTLEQMYAALSSFALERDPGSQFEYSNWGFGLLGDALARCADTEFVTLLERRITRPLSMSDTTFYPTTDMKGRLAAGHGAALESVPNEGRGALDAAGGLYSTADDLLRFVEAFLGRGQSSLGRAMALMPTVHRPTDDERTQIALGWRISTRGAQRIFWSNGRADGYRSYMAFDAAAGIGVVALANAGTNAGADDIGLYVLNQDTSPIRAHPRKALAAAVLDQYVGSYRFEDGAIFTMQRHEDHLLSQMTGQQSIPIFAASERDFYPQDVEARITFDAPVGGRSEALTLDQDGQSWRAVRVDE